MPRPLWRGRYTANPKISSSVYQGRHGYRYCFSTDLTLLPLTSSTRPLGSGTASPTERAYAMPPAVMLSISHLQDGQAVVHHMATITRRDQFVPTRSCARARVCACVCACARARAYVCMCACVCTSARCANVQYERTHGHATCNRPRAHMHAHTPYTARPANPCDYHTVFVATPRVRKLERQAMATSRVSGFLPRCLEAGGSHRTTAILQAVRGAAAAVREGDAVCDR